MAGTPHIVVYGPASAPYNDKVNLALAYKRLPFETVEPTGPEDFKRWSPTGKLPLMDYDGERVPDSTEILDFLDRRHPDPPLQARNPWVARSQRRLETWVGETFYFYWVRGLRLRLADVDAKDPAGAELAQLGLLGRVTRALSSSDPGDSLPNFSLGRDFPRRLTDLTNFLGDRPYFYADQLSRADLAVVAFLRSLQWDWFPDGAKLLDSNPNLRALMGRVAEATGR